MYVEMKLLLILIIIIIIILLYINLGEYVFFHVLEDWMASVCVVSCSYLFTVSCNSIWIIILDGFYF